MPAFGPRHAGGVWIQNFAQRALQIGADLFERPDFGGLARDDDVVEVSGNFSRRGSGDSSLEPTANAISGNRVAKFLGHREAETRRVCR